jgi:hypothetical protein
MHSTKKLEFIKNIRLVTIIVIGTFGTLATSFLVANGLRNSVNAHAPACAIPSPASQFQMECHSPMCKSC